MRKTLGALLLLAAPVLARPITPADLYTLPRVNGCQLSPDGRTLAVEMSRYDLPKDRLHQELRLYAWGQTTPLRTFPEAGGARWSPDSRKLLYSSKQKPWIWDGRTSVEVKGAPQDAEAVVWGPDSATLAFAAPVPRPRVKDSGRLYDDLFLRRWNHYYDGRRRHLYVLRPGGKARDVTPGEFDAYPTSGTFSAGDNFCFSKDGKALLFSAPTVREQAISTNYDVYRVDLARADREILTLDNPAADMGPRLSADGGTLYILSQRQPGAESDERCVRSCPVDAGGRPTGDWQDSQEEFSEFLPARGGELVARFSKERNRAYWRVGGQLKELHERGSAHSLSVDRAGRRWAGLIASLTHPPELTYGEIGGASHALPLWEMPYELGVVESREVLVEDQTMQMWLIQPPNFDPARKWPVAYLIHGGPQGGWADDWSVRWNPHVWAARGYLVAMPNPRGSSGRGKKFERDVSRDWGGKAYRDLMAGADAVAALPYVDRDRMAAAGASYGGYMVNWIAVHTGRFKALVSHCGVWNLDSMAGTTDELWFNDWEFGGVPWGNRRPADYDRFSPHKFADKLAVYKTPHMVIHNDLDYRVPINQGLELFTALQRQGVPSQFLNFPDEGHWVVQPHNSVRWYREVLAFVQRYCPSGGR